MRTKYHSSQTAHQISFCFIGGLIILTNTGKVEGVALFPNNNPWTKGARKKNLHS